MRRLRPFSSLQIRTHVRAWNALFALETQFAGDVENAIAYRYLLVRTSLLILKT